MWEVHYTTDFSLVIRTPSPAKKVLFGMRDHHKYFYNIKGVPASRN